MARARLIKPAFFQNEILGDMTPLTRLLFIGLWTIADREGRLADRPKRIKAQLLSYDDVTSDDADKMLNELQDSGFILRYESGDNWYIQIVSFLKHQNPHCKEKASEIPPPDIAPYKHSASTVQAPDKNGTSRALTLNPLTLTLNPEHDAPASSKSDSPSIEFETFWSVYPKRTEKQSAWKCWQTRLKEGHSPDELITAARHYAAECAGTDPKFIKHPKTFIGPNKPFLDFVQPKQDTAVDKYQEVPFA